MNGVRRFFAATNTTTSSPPLTEPTADPGTSPPKTSPLQTILPLSIGGKQSSSTVSSPKSPVQSSPSGTIQAGLFSRKDISGSSRRTPGSTETKAPHIRQPSFATSTPSTSVGSSARSPTPPIDLTSSATSTNGSSRQPIPAPLAKREVSALGSDGRQTPIPVDTRNDLLMSLLASEAIVDSREYEVLTAEEVEELKREQQVLFTQLGAMRKKVGLETKIRDAAVNLQKLQTVKRLSEQTSEQVDSGNRKLDIATKELSRLQERAASVDRKLLEHRAGVLSLSVRDLEAKASQGNLSGDSREEATRTRAMSSDLSSPTSSVMSITMRPKFDGAHLFAGHADAVIPGFSRKPASSAQIAALEEKLKIAEEAVAAAEAKGLELEEKVNRLRLEKSEVEATLNLDLQTAKTTILKLERNVTEMEDADRDRERWHRQRQTLENDLKSRSSTAEQLERRVRQLEADGIKITELEIAAKEKDEEIRQLRSDAEREREDWKSLRSQLQRETKAEVQRIRETVKNYQASTEQLDAGLDALRSIVRSQKVPTSPSESSLTRLVAAVGAHLASLSARLEESDRQKADLEKHSRKYEEDVRNGFEIRERLGREVEEARKEREDARKEVRLLEIRLKEEADRAIERANLRPPPPVSKRNDQSEEHAKTLAALRGLWFMLPSVEARVSKMGKSNSLAPASAGGGASLSDLDVRALKGLYDPKAGFNSPTLSGDFSVEEFVERVQALIADDRSLVERLIRFAQSHDLLRNNAARAQKLAQESSKGLEMYQIQVKTLEERNASLTNKQLTMSDEVNLLQQSVTQAMQEKRDLEAQLIENGETIRNLQESNNKLSARTLAFAEEAAAAPNALKVKLESQLTDVRSKLVEAQDEIDRMRNSEATQRVALLDELNSLQQENGKLRDQLRAKK